MRVLEQLQPQKVFYYFEELCRIPHPSGSTKAISDYCAAFAKERGLEYYQDSLNNVIIIQPASPGYEKSPAVILQGHLDMVAEKDPDSPIDFTRDGLDLRLDGDAIFAKGTTLGGDDGIAVALALAVLDSPELAHPRLEAVFTVDEETGMDGAKGLDCTPLQGRLMLNMDSEEEGIFTVSCAGGTGAVVSIPLTRQACGCGKAKVAVTGLTGGHSGAEIDKGRANANILLGRVLNALRKAADFRLIACGGGQKDNAIPLAAEAEIALCGCECSAAEQVCRDMEAALRREYAVSDPNLTVTFTPCGEAESCCDPASTEKVLDFLLLTPNGVAAMSQDMPDLVQTSSNLGILRSHEDALEAHISIRSSVTTQKRMLLERVQHLAVLLGGAAEVAGDYPAWEYKRESALRDLMAEVYQDQYGTKPQILAIHAGLECGLFSDKLPGLDCVSFGPDMQDIHTSREKLSAASVQRIWAFLTEVLRRLR